MVPAWPPDAFALTAHALRHAGAYIGVLSNWPPPVESGKEWADHCEAVAKKWRGVVVKSSSLPKEVQSCWGRISAGLDQPLADLSDSLNSEPARAMLELMAYADQACLPLAAERVPGASFDPISFVFARKAFEQMQRKNATKSLCREIDVSRLRVLPKARVPQRGLTIRSLSLYVGLCEGAEIETTFIDHQSYPEAPAINILLLPWPLRVRPAQFRQTRQLTNEMATISDEFGFFTYESAQAGKGFEDGLEDLLEEAAKECGPVNMVVLPELALSSKEVDSVRNLLNFWGCTLITGVGEAAVSGSKHGTNRLQFSVPGYEAIVEQEKQHRWKLDSSQVIQYSLGSSLHHETAWWEHIDIARRRLALIRMHPELTACALICEDLARSDPAGDQIRALGPNLVVALLMDGPQLLSRWAARHATTLAEDPGCSVLTLTSLGMSQLSRPGKGPNRDRVIALWKQEGGSAEEIELPLGSAAAVLSISMKHVKDWSADGRSRCSNIPSLTGVRFLKAEKLSTLPL